ncbi:hypothetical protein AAFC00_003742 [Neodothiora populina]|uniref:Uncharacterized protein n=1 Tax=Neodothiora populina TaxID=2781224 RepID=A0ABR3PFB8_9PEZI
MKLAGNVGANDLTQSTLVGSVNVLVNARLDVELVCPPFLLDSLESSLNLREFVFAQDTAILVAASPRDRSADILRVESAVKINGLVIGDHYRVEAALKRPPQSMFFPGAFDMMCN